MSASRNVSTCSEQINELNAFRFRQVSEMGFINKISRFVTVQTPSKVPCISVNNLPQNIQSFGGELKYLISDRLPAVKTKHTRPSPPKSFV